MAKRWRLLFTNLIFTVVMLVGIALSGVGPAVAGESISEVNVLLEPGLTFQQVAEVNHTSLDMVGTAFGIKGLNQGDQKIDEYLKSQSKATVAEKLRKLIIEKNLEDNKNWTVVFIKLALWALLIVGSGVLLARRKASHTVRLVLLTSVVILLGFVLGSDPNPLGMIKDALYIYGTTGVIFKPRIIVATAILLTVLVGGRLYCGWGCHLGALQELLYTVPLKKFRIPFFISNTLRLLVFVAIIAAALIFGLDLLGPVDPYQLFNFNTALGVLLMAGSILILSLFTYRPWCTLACPFGFLSWLTEKVSFLKIVRKEDVCKNCGACSGVCPTVRANSRLVGLSSGECYYCGRCLEACQHNALEYRRNKGTK